MKKVLFLLTFILFISCKETEFSAGLENRLTAIIDMSPETNYNNVDFTSDDNLGGLCPDHEMVYINKHDDGSLNNEYYVITIEAKDYFKSENNCNEYSWYNTEEEDVRHKLIINVYTEEISSYMYFNSSRYTIHPNMPTTSIVAYYKLETNADSLDNNGLGIEYFGHDAEIEILDLDLSSGVMSGTLNATLFRGTPVANPSDYLGVDNVADLDLYNPSLGDFVGDIDGDGFTDYHLTDSIRIENCVFQRITVINNVP